MIPGTRRPPTWKHRLGTASLILGAIVFGPPLAALVIAVVAAGLSVCLGLAAGLLGIVLPIGIVLAPIGMTIGAIEAIRNRSLHNTPPERLQRATPAPNRPGTFSQLSHAYRRLREAPRVLREARRRATQLFRFRRN